MKGIGTNRKGVYHLKVVDEVIQFKAVCTVEKINETYLLQALESLL